jgi:hypothetical protein
MIDDLTIFSMNQAITSSAASNYAGTGGGSAGAGILDTAGLGSLGLAVTKFILFIAVGIPFTGPVGSTLTVVLQDSPDGITFATTDLGNTITQPLISLIIPGIPLLAGPLPIVGGGTNPPNFLDRFLRCYYTVGGGPFTAGTVNAFLMTE